MSEHYDDGEPLDPSMFDEERFRNLIELGLVNLNHSDRERADRFLRAGAAFVARSVGEDVEIGWSSRATQRSWPPHGLPCGEPSLNLCATKIAVRSSRSSRRR